MTSQKNAVSRRRFLRCAAATSAALPIIVPRSALGDEARPAAGERITLGFIGVGTQGRGLLGGFLGQRDVQVLAVSDVDTNRRENARKMVEQRYAEQMKS